MRRSFSVPSTILCVALVFPLLGADPETEPGSKKRTDKDIAAGKKAAEDYLGKLKAKADQVEYVKDEPVHRAIPAYLFFGVRFRQFPVARPAPKGLSPSNLFAVDRDGKVKVLTTPKELERFLKAKLPAAKTDAKITDITRMVLRLTQEFSQDGFYRFQIVDQATKVAKGKDGKVAGATAALKEGGMGTFAVEVRFDDAGKLVSIRERPDMRAGPRPICQASKLLDKDPIVRGMAEQALRVMGRPCKAYLDEQRAKASPELQKAIDAMWRKISDQDR